MFWKKDVQPLAFDAETPYVTAIVPAAGSSARMCGLDKRFEDLGGAPVIVRTLQALAQSVWISEIVLAVQAREIPLMLELVHAYGIAKMRSVVAGGQTRQQSVLRALEAVSGQTQYIAIHDGARPLVSEQVIANAVLAAKSYGAAAAAVNVVDTVKIADEKRLIVSTPPRSSLYAVQTPQVFLLEQYKQAVAASKEKGTDYTDDCQMLEAIGVPVYLSAGAYENIKITTPVDLLTVQALVQQEEEEI